MQDGKVTEAVESLQPLEKMSRLDCDMKSNQRVLRHMVKLAFEAKNWDLLCDTIKTLCKKRLLIKMNIKPMVWGGTFYIRTKQDLFLQIQDCCDMVEKIPNEATKSKLIDTLRAVTAGKVDIEKIRKKQSISMFYSDLRGGGTGSTDQAGGR